MLTLAIGSDHRGYDHKAAIQQMAELKQKKITWIDVGSFNQERTDYPPFAHKVVQTMRAGSSEGGVLLCGSGVGMAIAANRFMHIYAALVWNCETAARAKEEDNANILVLPADYITPVQACNMVEAWLNAQFLHDRYQKRIDQIDAWKGL